MSAFSTSPRPRIVNGVLIKECSDNKRCNGLQGTNSKEDIYRAILEMPSAIPEADIRDTESVSVECNSTRSYSPQENYSNPENINRPAHFSQERRNITGNSETYSADCDHRQAFEPQECEQQTPSFCTHSNSHNYLTVKKLDMEQDRPHSDTCYEGKHLIHRDKWESGDHRRSMVDGSVAVNEEGRHFHPEICYHNTPASLNKNQPKHLYKGSSPQNARRDSTPEECWDQTHHHTCPHTHEEVFTESKPLLRTPNSTRLHEQVIDGNTENCIALMNPKDSCSPLNASHEKSSRGRNRTMQYEKPEGLVHPHGSSLDYLYAPQGCRLKDEQSLHNQDTEREEFNLTKGQFEECSGYPPQRRIIKHCNMTTEDDNCSPQGNLNAGVLRNKQHESHRFIRRKGQVGNVTEREARSVAEILNHPVMDIHPVESEVLTQQCPPLLQTLNSEDGLGYPPQPTLLPKSKYSVHRACENDSQNDETHCNYYTQKRQVTGRYDHSNDSWTRAEGEHEQTCAGQRRNVKFGRNEDGGHVEYCRGYNKTVFNHPHIAENEREEIITSGPVQDTVCVNQEQHNKSTCMECLPRTFHPEAQEQHYHSHHRSKTPDEETNNFSVKKLPKEAESHVPVSCEGHKSHFHHRDQIINEVNSRRRTKELYGGSTKSSCRAISACHEDESYRKENENVLRTPEGHCKENPLPNSIEHSEAYKNVSGEDGHSLQDIAPHDELQAREREKCFARNTNIPTRSYNYCDADHAREHPHPRVSELHPKAIEGLREYSATPSCDVTGDDNIVPCYTDRLCSPDESALESSGLNEQCITKPYRRKNGLEDEDIERTNAENRGVSFEENEEKEGTRKHRTLILQNARQNSTSQNKCETLSKLNNAHAMTGSSEEQKNASNLTSKTRIPKLKANAHSTSNKNNTVAGCLQQRPKRTTSLKP